MGLFNRKKTDAGRAEETPRAQQTDSAPEAEPQTEVTAVIDADPQPSPEPPQPVAETPEVTEPVAEVAEAPEAPEASQPEMTPPEPEEAEPKISRAEPEAEEAPEEEPAATEASANDDPDTGTLEKDELRRAVAGTAKKNAGEAWSGETSDDDRVSADDLIAPTMRKRHPYAPEPAAEPDAERRMKVYAFANQKGGVAKTTTTLNLAVALSESGHKVLCVDLDPQGNLTMSQGVDPDEVEKSLYDVLVNDMPIAEIIQHREVDIAVASIDLAGAEIAMSTKIGRERSLQKALAQVADVYDFVCIDTPPSLGLLTINALTAADKVIVPVQCEYLSMRGLVQLQNTLEMIRENLNPNVQIEGILPTMLDSRTVHAKEAVEILEENFGDLVFNTRIKKAIKFAEAPVKGSSVLKYDPSGNAAKSYRDLAEEVLTHGEAT
jgi:chromosome partitioning protein